jgi:RimJ/RimL family protein N-acetyltransferase
VRRADDVILGEIGHVWNRKDGSAQVGYSLAEPSWGQGYATEALQALAAALFAYPEVKRVVADTLVDHIASRRVMEKAGMVLTGQRTEEDNGEVLNLVRYELARPG